MGSLPGWNSLRKNAKRCKKASHSFWHTGLSKFVQSCAKCTRVFSSLLSEKKCVERCNCCLFFYIASLQIRLFAISYQYLLNKQVDLICVCSVNLAPQKAVGAPAAQSRRGSAFCPRMGGGAGSAWFPKIRRSLQADFSCSFFPSFSLFHFLSATLFCFWLSFCLYFVLHYFFLCVCVCVCARSRFAENSHWRKPYLFYFCPNLEWNAEQIYSPILQAWNKNSHLHVEHLTNESHFSNVITLWLIDTESNITLTAIFNLLPRKWNLTENEDAKNIDIDSSLSHFHILLSGTFPRSLDM